MYCIPLLITSKAICQFKTVKRCQPRFFKCKFWYTFAHSLGYFLLNRNMQCNSTSNNEIVNTLSILFSFPYKEHYCSIVAVLYWDIMTNTSKWKSIFSHKALVLQKWKNKHNAGLQRIAPWGHWNGIYFMILVIIYI